MASKVKVESYKETFYKTVGAMSRRKQGFTIDDVVAKIGNPPQGRHALGALTQGATNKYGLHIKDYQTSTAPSRRYARVARWAK